jgi:glycosyltransferase involved in cell wall biosynthesis
MAHKIYIFDSHPVQYKAPVYQALQALMPDAFELIYATDASVRAGTMDKDFGKEIAWDTPLLSGYRYRVLGNERGVPFSSPASLSGRGVFSLLKAERPQAVVLTQSHYWFDHAAYFSCLVLGIPILIRQETQDEMFAGRRPWLKERVRALAYRALYRPVRHAFAFGQLNHQHLVRHGIPPDRISFARFSVPDPIAHMSLAQREAARTSVRQTLGVNEQTLVVAFFGKFIPKKNPDLLFACLPHLPTEVRRRLHLLFVGSGELQPLLKTLAQDAERTHGVRSTFTGFVNQSQLAPYYLAADTVALPSRRMGEAWGLVVNEALNAGCSVVMSDAVGCVSEFGDLAGVQVIPEEDAPALAKAISTLSAQARVHDWASEHMADYSSEAAARGLGQVLVRYLPPEKSRP